ncbi:MAG: YkvA family protein [Chloroflexota bacterium]|nr:YkvA family protein [Chloroflexota bacterium]
MDAHREPAPASVSPSAETDHPRPIDTAGARPAPGGQSQPGQARPEGRAGASKVKGTIDDPVLEGFWAALRRLPRYVRLAAHLAGDPRVPKQAKTALVVGGAYTVSPVDLVPGIIPVAGQLDDLFVLLFAVRQALRSCPPGVAEEHLNRVKLTPKDLDDDVAAVRGTARWLAGKALRTGGRLAAEAGRLLWAAVRRR